jgi:hypothetical protein
MVSDTEPPPTEREEDRTTWTGDELDAIVGEQDEGYRAAWRDYVAPLRGREAA